jgi:hypothetical protein
MTRVEALHRVCFGVVAALFCVILGACSAGWRVREKADAHQLPKHVTIYVVMSDQVAATDSGLAAAVVDALATELMKRGHEAPIEVAKLGEKVPVPRIELQIVGSQGGNAEMRGAGQFGGVLGAPGAAVGAGAGVAGASSITVDCYVVQANGNVTFRGRIGGASLGNTTGYDAVEAGEAVGLKIASSIAD